MVWIIDDDEVFQMITIRNIRKAGFDCECSSYYDGSEAIDRLQSDFNQNLPAPELILLDLNMPICDGWGFLDAYAKLPTAYKAKTRLFICSSSIDPADIKRSQDYPDVIDFLDKPVDDRFLHTQLEKLHGPS